MTVDDLESALDGLYALEPGAFVAERDRLAKELRGEGRREEAEQVKQLRKPSLSAWTINRLAREQRKDVDLLLDAGHRLRETQQDLLTGKDTGSLDEARRAERTALAALQKAALRILEEEGRGSETTLGRVTSTLQNAVVSDEGRELLARGRLTADLEATGFDLLAPAPSGAKRAPSRQKADSKRAPSTAQRDKKRQQEARSRLDQAKAAAKEAAKGHRAARAEVDRGRRQLAQAEGRLRTAEEDAARTEAAVERAEQELREAKSTTR